ncbi:MAG: hypothetical protein GY910_20065 [bacterium]|nr:hypothetical protein [bacterium]
MLLGFNTNFRYRGVLFHVQTEDSGLENPHVITHLFHGGNIMASEKHDYSELLGTIEGVEREDAVRKLMESQHKLMLKGLSRGQRDSAIEQRMGAGVFRVEGASEAVDPSPVVTEEAPPTPVEPKCLETDTSDPERAEPASRLSRVFGDRVVSEKPLDEVVLDYLVENARKRKRSTK